MRGFSLAEVLVSLGILAMAVVALFNLAGSAVKMSSKTENTVIAGDIAEQQLNAAVSLALRDEPAGAKEEFWDNDYSDTPWREGAVKVNKTSFNYELFATTLVDAESGDPVGQVTPFNRVKKVDIVVWWMTSKPNEQRQGYGRLTASATRLVNEEPPEE